MIFFKILVYKNFESNAKKVILGAFLSESGKNGIIEVIFFTKLSMHNFFRDKIPIFRKKIGAPSGGQW